MRYFKSNKDEIFAYDDEQIEQGLSKGLVELSETEVDSFKLFGVFNKTENEIISKKNELKIIQQKEAFNNAIQTHLDTKAKEFRYDNMMSARSYAGYENPFQAEAQKLAVWASNCWVKAGEIEADVQAGNRDMPTIDEVLAELPVYE